MRYYQENEKKIKSLPESCFQEVSDYLDTLIIRMKVSDETTAHRDLGDYAAGVIFIEVER